MSRNKEIPRGTKLKCANCGREVVAGQDPYIDWEKKGIECSECAIIRTMEEGQ